MCTFFYAYVSLPIKLHSILRPCNVMTTAKGWIQIIDLTKNVNNFTFV